MPKFEQVLISGTPCLKGNPPLRNEPWWDFPVGTKFWQIGYHRNSSCRALVFDDGATYAGRIVLDDSNGSPCDYVALKTPAKTKKNDGYLFQHDVFIYMLIIPYQGEPHHPESDRGKEIWLQLVDQLNIFIMKPVFEIDENGERRTIDMRTDYWKKRHSKPKRKR